jgi:hypothetical protein
MLGVVVGPSSLAYAAPSPDTRTVPVSVQQSGRDTILLAFLDSDWQVGDCTLFAAGTKVEFNVTRGWLIWDGVGRTSKTKNGDIWHSTFHYEFFGTPSLTVGALDSDKMTVVNRDYDWQTPVTGLPRGVVASQLVWESSC